MLSFQTFDNHLLMTSCYFRASTNTPTTSADDVPFGTYKFVFPARSAIEKWLPSKVKENSKSFQTLCKSFHNHGNSMT